MEGLPGWVIRPMPGPPPRQHKHERQYTPSSHSVIPTRRIWNDDDDGQMIFGDLGGLKFPDICLTGEKKPRKILTQETCPDRGSNPGPLRDKRACCHLLHSGGLKDHLHRKFWWNKGRSINSMVSLLAIRSELMGLILRRPLFHQNFLWRWSFKAETCQIKI